MLLYMYPLDCIVGNRQSSIFLMLFLHLSDIHFHSSDVNKPYDQNLGLRDDIVHDVREMRNELARPIDAILISGDIAYHGSEEEYAYAFSWLRDALCPASGCKIENIFVIPGNHDVDRNASKSPMHADARKALRGAPPQQANRAITRFVDDKASSEMLFTPIENYNRFAAKFLCEIGFVEKESDTKPYACRDFQLNDNSIVRVWGFNSVLVSDATDDVNNMYVDPSAAQIVKRENGVVHLVMCHHPFNWLRNGSEFRERIEGVAQLHLFGHEHTLRVEDNRRFTRIRAGALHPDRDEAGWSPGYNIIDLSVSGTPTARKLNITIWVRQRQNTHFIPVPDHDGKSPWVLDHKLDNWTAPPNETKVQEPIVVELGASEGPVEASLVTTEPKALSMRTVAMKMLGLREFDQRNIITALNLHQDGDQRLRDYEFALAAVRRASQRGSLEQLNNEIDKYVSEGDR